MIKIFYRQGEEILLSQSKTEFAAISKENALWIDLLDPTGEEKRAAEAFLGATIQSRAQAEEIESSSRYHEADGIIYEQVKFCDPWAYERMVVTHVLHDDYGYQVLSIDRPYNVSGVGQLRTRVQAFIESLEIKKIQGGAK